MNKLTYFIIFLFLMNIGGFIRLSISGHSKKSIYIILLIANIICLFAYLVSLPDLSFHSWVKYFRGS
jgi:hypothetical protein